MSCTSLPLRAALALAFCASAAFAATVLNPSFEETTPCVYVTTGDDGVCETTAAGDDVQLIPLAQGDPNSICIGPGDNAVLDTAPQPWTDDFIDGQYIRTGPNGICDNTVLYGTDDEQIIEKFEGEPDALCVGGGPNATLDTTPAGDDGTTTYDIPADWIGYATTDPDWAPHWFESFEAGFDMFGWLDRAKTGARIGVAGAAMDVLGPVYAPDRPTVPRNGGVYQTVGGLTPSTQYNVKVFFHTDCRDSETNIAHQDNLGVRLGVDPSGGSNPALATFTGWYYTPDENNAKDVWLRLHIDFMSAAATATVFLEYKMDETVPDDVDVMWCAFEDVSIDEGVALDQLYSHWYGYGTFYHDSSHPTYPGKYWSHEVFGYVAWTGSLDPAGMWYVPVDAAGRVDWGTEPGVYTSTAYDPDPAHTGGSHHNSSWWTGEQITAGPDGVCDSAAAGDDVQVVAQGTTGLHPDTMCIYSGLDHVLDSTVIGDDGTRDMQVHPLEPNETYYFRCTAEAAGYDPGSWYEESRTMPVRITEFSLNSRTFGSPPESYVDVSFNVFGPGNAENLEGIIEWGPDEETLTYTTDWYPIGTGETNYRAEDGIVPGGTYFFKVRIRLDDHPYETGGVWHPSYTASDWETTPATGIPVYPALMNGDRYRRTGPEGEILDTIGHDWDSHTVADYWLFTGSDYWYTARREWYPTMPPGIYAYDASFVLGCGYDRSWIYQAFATVPGEWYMMRSWSKGYNGQDPELQFADLTARYHLDPYGRDLPGEGSVETGEWWWMSGGRDYYAPQMRDHDFGGNYGDGWYHDWLPCTAQSEAMTLFGTSHAEPGAWQSVAWTGAQIWGAAKIEASAGAKAAGTLRDGWNLLSVPMYFSADDVQLIPLGQTDTTGICVGPGDNAVLYDYSLDIQGDDTLRDASVTTGFLGVCDTSAAGDDVQVIPVGQGAPDAVAITAGPNLVLDTTPSGDDAVAGDTITTGADGICNSSAAGDDVQVIFVDYGEADAVCVTGGPDGCLDTHISLFYDDLIIGATAVCVGPDGICATTAMDDDTQDVPVGSGPRCIGPGPDGVVQAPEGGDDYYYGPYVVCGGNGVCDTEVITGDAEDVFEDLADAGLLREMYNYTPGGGYGSYPLDWQKIECGRAYWVRLVGTADCTCRFGEILGSDQTIQLANGWNMIGHPFLFEVPVDDIMVSNGVETVSLEEASLPPYSWVQLPLYYYEGVYKTVQASGGDSAAMEPWRGYWMLAYVPDLELTIRIARPR